MPLTNKDRAFLSEIVGQFLTGLEEILAEHRRALQTSAAPQSSDEARVAPTRAKPNEKFCRSRDDMAAATGISRWTLKAIAALAKGQPDNPFRGRGAYPSDIRRWLEQRPDFAPRLAFPKNR